MGAFIVPVLPDKGPKDEHEKYSGARVLRMILLSIGESPTKTVGTGQIGNLSDPAPPDALYSYTSKFNDPSEPNPFWWIDPGAMVSALSRLHPQGPELFVQYKNPGHTEADNQLHSTLKDYKVAAATLAYGGKHWICVTGYSYNNPDDYTGFYFNDPIKGSMTDAWLSTADWDGKDTAVSGGAQWLNQIVEVGDPRPVQEDVVAAPRPIVRSGDSLISPDDAIKLAIDGALQHCPELPHLSRAIKDGRPGSPRLVAHMDSEGDYYYLVPLEVESQPRAEALAVIKVDARLGDVLSAAATEEPMALWPIQPEDVRDLVTRTPISVHEPVETATNRLLDTLLRSRRGSDVSESAVAWLLDPSLRQTLEGALASHANPREYVLIRPHEIEIDPIWAWAPCGGISPLYPYYQVRTPWRKLYVNAQTAVIKTSFDLCTSEPLGG